MLAVAWLTSVLGVFESHRHPNAEPVPLYSVSLNTTCSKSRGGVTALVSGVLEPLQEAAAHAKKPT
jgi:hypothetical protein